MGQSWHNDNGTTEESEAEETAVTRGTKRRRSGLSAVLGGRRPSLPPGVFARPGVGSARAEWLGAVPSGVGWGQQQ